jgi:hypothetical protein
MDEQGNQNEDLGIAGTELDDAAQPCGWFWAGRHWATSSRSSASSPRIWAGAAPVVEQTIRHVEAAAVACRVHGKVPQELASAPELDPKLRSSMKALADDYRSPAPEILQAKAKAELDHADANEE